MYQGQVQAAKPLLSEEIRAAMETGGPEAAKQRMAELYPARKDEYQVDMQGFTRLGMSYMQEGNHAAAEAVLEMVPLLLDTAMAASPYAAQMQQMAEQERRQEEAPPPAVTGAESPPPGPALIPGDSNKGALVDNAVVTAGHTRLLFHTFPRRGDPNSGKDCPLNYYAATLRPGLPQPELELLASEVCGFVGTGGRLLDNGDLLLVTRNQLQRWRGGKVVSSVNLSTLPALGAQDYDAARAVHLHAITSTGETVLLIPGGGYMPGEFEAASFLLLALDARGEQRWRLPVYPEKGGGAVNRVWLSDDGMVLVQALAINEGQDGGGIGSRHLLHLVSRDGQALGTVEIARDVQPSMEDLAAAGEKGLESAMAMAGEMVLESVERIAAQSAPGGGFYVLIQRRSDDGQRYGHFLYHLDADGNVRDQRPMNRMIRPYRLEEWVDFSIRGKELLLLASAMVEQPGVTSRRKQYRQNVVGRIDLEKGFQEARLVPLDRRYLEAVMNAGDAELKYIDDRPGGDPVLLSRLADKPLAVTLGYLSRHEVPRVDEIGDDQALFAGR
jgi:hypothetical protein